MTEEKKKSPIMSGWRGHLTGAIEGTNTSHIKVSHICLDLDHATAWALCNMLTDEVLEKAYSIEGKQKDTLSNLGAAIGRLIDHHAANNGGRDVVKP